MRLISFALTTEQYEARTKDVTRRLGWKQLPAGTHLTAARKCMGLKPGEKVEKLHALEVISVISEPLKALR